MKRFPGSNLLDFFRLIRLPNLVIVALTMMLMRYAIIRPILHAMPLESLDIPVDLARMELQLRWFDFLILVLSTVFITAGGYVINDYFDIRTDLINRGSVIVGNTIPRRTAMMYHNVFNFIGVAGGFYIGIRIGYWWLGVMFLLISGLLYFYSTTYKRQFLIGNFIVALLTALVPFLVVLCDALPVHKFYSVRAESFPGVSILFYWVGGFSLFAFLTTLIREIVKDIEDYDGDFALGRKTLPVVSGILTARVVVVLLALIEIILLYLVWYKYLSNRITLAYITLFLSVPFVLVIVKIITGKTKKAFHSVSLLVKIIIVAGILYSVVAGAIITTGKVY